MIGNVAQLWRKGDKRVLKKEFNRASAQLKASSLLRIVFQLQWGGSPEDRYGPLPTIYSRLSSFQFGRVKKKRREEEEKKVVIGREKVSWPLKGLDQRDEEEKGGGKDG